MTDVVRELSVRTALPQSDWKNPALVDDLIARAKDHPLGLDFLRHGMLGSVATVFGVHAFTVEAARARLGAASV